MKKLRLIILFSLIFSCLIALCSCDKLEKLSAPARLEIEYTNLVLKWTKVKDARLYTISVQKEGEEEPKEFMASKTEYPLTNLAEGTYTLKVKANGKEDVSKDSEWSEPIVFEREHESGLVFVLNKAGTEYTVAQKGLATGDIVIPDTYRKKPVTEIGDHAFFNKSDVTSVVIGKNVRRIGTFAFANCSFITEITFPEGLTELGDGAFASCRLLGGELVIPDGVSVIPKSCFSYCGSLEGLTIGAGVKTIGENAFVDCSSLSGVYIPGTVETIGAYAFAVCKGLTGVNIVDGVKTIGEYAFSEVTGISTVTIPNSVTSIGEGAFYKCSALSSVNLGKGVRSIALGAFNSTPVWNNSLTNEIYVGGWFLGCKDSSVSSVNIADNTVGIASMALYGYENITYLEIPDSVKIIDSAAFARSSLMSVILGAGVEEIGDEAFAACKELVDVILGSYNDYDGCIATSSLKSIGSYAFNSCEALESIEMPVTLESVGTQAFRDSGIYKSASGVVYAGNWAVDYNEGITENVNLREGTVGVANYAFYKCDKLNGFKAPTSLKIIGRAAFYDCSALISVELPSTLTVIQDYTFYRCKSLKLFSLPPELTYIGRSAFYKCESTALAKETDTANDVLTIPSGVTYIGDYAFYGCGYKERSAIGEKQDYNLYGVDTVVLPSGMEQVGANAFWGFNSLKSVYLGGTVTLGEKAFYKCTALESVDFGTGLVTIGEKAFYKCELLKSVVLPASVKHVGDYAFYKCIAIDELELGRAETLGAFSFYGNYSLTSIVLPDSLLTVGRQAFRKCDALTSVTVGDGIATIEDHAFYGCNSLTIYLEGEKAPEGWSKRWNSSYRPVVSGCVLSEDDSYVLYYDIGVGEIKNLNSANFISDPQRVGYTFLGWGTSSGATVPAFTSENIAEAEGARKLYAIWVENDVNFENE